MDWKQDAPPEKRRVRVVGHPGGSGSSHALRRVGEAPGPRATRGGGVGSGGFGRWQEGINGIPYGYIHGTTARRMKTGSEAAAD